MVYDENQTIFHQESFLLRGYRQTVYLYRKKVEAAKIILKPGKEAAVRRFHPWVFSGAIDSMKGTPQDGDVVEVLDSGGETLATGHYCTGSIAVKILAFSRRIIDSGFWQEKLETALACRQRAELTTGVTGNAYRLAFTEGDLLPGLIIDFYNGVAVVQAETTGMRRSLQDLTVALQALYGSSLKAVYDKVGGVFLEGNSGPVEITESGHRFIVDFVRGQKTGFFLDQRPNRLYAQFYSSGKKVLNLFSYSAAFSVYALKGGAASVCSVDSSRQATDWAVENCKLNGIEEARHQPVVADAKTFLSGNSERFDLIIVDPPAFAKSRHLTNNALHAYSHLNAAAIRSLSPGGKLFTFSCSQPVSREMFRSALHSAAILAGRPVRILHQLSQGPDHPVSLFHPESEYLKGFILEAE